VEGLDYTLNIYKIVMNTSLFDESVLASGYELVECWEKTA
jgi:hypothetical protein